MKPQISVLIPCGGRQDMLDATLPCWLSQKDINFEIVIVAGPTIKVPYDNRIVVVPGPEKFGLCKYMNLALKAARGAIVLITQSDMEPNNDHLILNMYLKMKENNCVSERFYKDGNRHSGLFLHMLMAYKKDIEAVGGWYEPYDDGYAWEDNDLAASLMENGVKWDHIIFDEEYASHHLPHGRPDINDPDIKEKHDKNKAIYESRHSRTLLLTYARQFLLAKRKCL